VNRNVCKGCVRYCGEYPGSEVAWLCAKTVDSYWSRQVPDHLVSEPGRILTVLVPSSSIPVWCERVVLHGFTTDGEDVEVKKDRRLAWAGKG
jgi:hypothetical protein